MAETPDSHAEELQRLSAMVEDNKTALAHYDLDEFRAGVLDELDLGDCLVQWGLDRYQVRPFEGEGFAVPAGEGALAILRGLVRYPIVGSPPEGWIRYERQKPCIMFELDDPDLVYVTGDDVEEDAEEEPGFGRVVKKEEDRARA